jgi:hypothetical protein
MTTPPTEEETRQLLARAAGTIDVDVTTPMTLTGLPEPRPRRWPVLAAAAAVLAAAGGGFLVAQQLGDEGPGPADGPVVEGEHAIGDGQMPAVIGMSISEARKLLESRGLEVTARQDNASCAPDGTVVLTEPAVGATVAPGDRVLLSATNAQAREVGIEPLGRPCGKREFAVWKLIRFARGLEAAPDFTPELTLSVRDGETRTITGDEAVDPQNWTICDANACHSALAAVTEMVSRPSYGAAVPGWRYSSPYLMVQDLSIGSDEPWTCPLSGQAGATPEWEGSFAIYLDPPDSIAGCESVTPPVVGVRLERGAIAEVALLATRAADADLVDRAEAERDAQLEETAAAFVAWARGEGPAPEFADRVRLLQGGSPPFGAQTWLRDPTDRWLYSMCSGLPPGRCGMDPIYQLDHYEGPVVPARGRALCVEGTADLPPYLADRATEDLVRLTKPEPPTCEQDLPVELWIDDDGLIYAVNLAAFWE